ncbi:MAG: LytTR family transcriptional regulator [Alphaproteobacteria bacterium]|nr:LytTR family transcriptional regulator [Alphaproteobacteria bacterium]
MTSGGHVVTSGGARFLTGPWVTIAILGLINGLVNITSIILEAQLDGDPVSFVEPLILEGSSYLLWLALAPFIGLAVQRLPPNSGNLPRSILGHLALTVPVSLVHVAGMVIIRVICFTLLGGAYRFFDDGIVLPLVYEWRKDVISYAVLAAIYWLYPLIVARRAKPVGDRIEIRDGATAIFLPPGDILAVEAAGNYVQFHTKDRVHMVRGTLATWEARLKSRGFARVHRSRLVNRARIGGFKSKASGDVEITLDDGRVVIGSRRYRDALAAAPDPSS